MMPVMPIIAAAGNSTSTTTIIMVAVGATAGLRIDGPSVPLMMPMLPVESGAGTGL